MKFSIKNIAKVITLSGVIALFSSCGLLDDETKDKISSSFTKLTASEESDDCSYYKDQYAATGKEEWQQLYEDECEDDFLESNTPEGLDADCKTKYQTMLKKTDSIVTSLQGKCNPENAETDATCKASQDEIDQLAIDFKEECDIDEFYVRAVEESGPKTGEKDGQCFWTAWVPVDTRQEGQTENMDLKCKDTPPECSKEMVNEVVRRVEIWEALDGQKVYLPCVEQYEYGFNPCDMDKDGVVTPTEVKQCEQAGDVKAPCDFNADGVVDDFEKSECGFYGDDGFKDAQYMDPCDFNFDGTVDQWEGEQCHNVTGCQEGEIPFWNEKERKDVCVKENEVPHCTHPTFPEYINGKIQCMDPCDMNRDLVVDETEKSNCKTVQCEMGEIPFWDNMQQKDVCIKESEIPFCQAPKMPEMINGKVQCIDPCDKNRDMKVDEWEKSNCQMKQCAEGTVPFWDHMAQQDKCINESDIPKCEYPSLPELINGKMLCVDPCDRNRDGKIDDFEKKNYCPDMDMPMM